jgi:asparagine synthase (glutamine-hydrolysing)
VGEGADELFWGYPTWKVKLRLQQADDLPVPNFLKRQALVGMKALGKSGTHSYEALRRSTLDQPVFWGGADAFTERQKVRLLSPRLRQRFEGYSSWEAIKPIHDRFRQNAWETSNLNWMSYLDLNLRLPELLLMRVDKMTMGVSLEGRVPFLDHKFVELGMSIPERMKTKNGTLKHMLKKAVRGVIPDEIIDRPKQGFGVPVHEWLFDKLGDRAQREINEFCRSTDLLDAKAVGALVASKNHSSLWYLLNLSMWWKEYIAR